MNKRLSLALGASLVLVALPGARAGAVERTPTNAAQRAVVSSPIVFEAGHRVWLLAGDGTPARLLVKPPAGFFDTQPAISADGRLVAFYRFGSSVAAQRRCQRQPRFIGCKDLMVARSDGTGLRRVARVGGATSGASSFSRDARRLVFTDEHLGLSVVNVNGSGRRELLRGPGRAKRGYAYDSPDWSADGTKIAYVRAPLLSQWFPDAAKQEVYLMNATGSARRSVSRSCGGEFTPRFAPDSVTLLFISADAPQWCGLILGKVNADGSGRTVFADAWATIADWLPDGDIVCACGKERSSARTLVVVDPETGATASAPIVTARAAIENISIATSVSGR